MGQQPDAAAGAGEDTSSTRLVPSEHDVLQGVLAAGLDVAADAGVRDAPAKSAVRAVVGEASVPPSQDHTPVLLATVASAVVEKPSSQQLAGSGGSGSDLMPLMEEDPAEYFESAALLMMASFHGSPLVSSQPNTDPPMDQQPDAAAVPGEATFSTPPVTSESDALLAAGLDLAAEAGVTGAPAESAVAVADEGEAEAASEGKTTAAAAGFAETASEAETETEAASAAEATSASKTAGAQPTSEIGVPVLFHAGLLVPADASGTLSPGCSGQRFPMAEDYEDSSILLGAAGIAGAAVALVKQAMEGGPDGMAEGVGEATEAEAAADVAEGAETEAELAETAAAAAKAEAAAGVADDADTAMTVAAEVEAAETGADAVEKGAETVAAAAEAAIGAAAAADADEAAAAAAVVLAGAGAVVAEEAGAADAAAGEAAATDAADAEVDVAVAEAGVAAVATNGLEYRSNIAAEAVASSMSGAKRHQPAAPEGEEPASKLLKIEPLDPASGALRLGVAAYATDMVEGLGAVSLLLRHVNIKATAQTLLALDSFPLACFGPSPGLGDRGKLLLTSVSCAGQLLGSHLGDWMPEQQLLQLLLEADAADEGEGLLQVLAGMPQAVAALPLLALQVLGADEQLLMATAAPGLPALTRPELLLSACRVCRVTASMGSEPRVPAGYFSLFKAQLDSSQQEIQATTALPPASLKRLIAAACFQMKRERSKAALRKQAIAVRLLVSCLSPYVREVLAEPSAQQQDTDAGRLLELLLLASGCGCGWRVIQALTLSLELRALAGGSLSVDGGGGISLWSSAQLEAMIAGVNLAFAERDAGLAGETDKVGGKTGESQGAGVSDTEIILSPSGQAGAASATDEMKMESDTDYEVLCSNAEAVMRLLLACKDRTPDDQQAEEVTRLAAALVLMQGKMPGRDGGDVPAWLAVAAVVHGLQEPGWVRGLMLLKEWLQQ